MADPTGEYVYMKDKQKAFQEVADKIGIGFQVEEPEWATSWEIRNNIASRYRNDRLIICGGCRLHTKAATRWVLCAETGNLITGKVMNSIMSCTDIRRLSHL